MDKPTILTCLQQNPSITLKTLCEKLRVDGNLDQTGQTGWLVGQLLRDGIIVRDEGNWTYKAKECT